MTLIDLSYKMGDKDRSIWPGNAPFVMKKVSEDDNNAMGCFIAHFNISMSEHVGTHIDAPYHFNPKGWTTDQIPLEHLVNIPAIVVDISHKCRQDVTAKLEASDLEDWVKRHGSIPDRCLVFMRSGWGKYYYSDPEKFLGTDNFNDESTLNFPGFGKSAIDWLLDNTSFVGIGVDSLSIELGRTQGCYVHRRLTGANKYGLECLANLEQVPETGATVTVLPLNIEGGSGGPCRVVAVC